MTGRHGGTTWAATCLACGKRSFTSRKAAKAEGKRVTRGRGPHTPITAYPCGQAWHWGHDTRRVRAAAADTRRGQACLIRAVARRSEEQP